MRIYRNINKMTQEDLRIFKQKKSNFLPKTLQVLNEKNFIPSLSPVYEFLNRNKYIIPIPAPTNEINSINESYTIS